MTRQSRSASVKNLRSARGREDFIESKLSDIFAAYGYRLGPEIQYGQAHRTWWFIRKGRRFQTESVLIQLRWKPKRLLSVDFFGSSLSPQELKEHGLAANAGGFDLFDYQFDYLNRPPKDLLGKPIALGPESEWPSVFERLQSEIERVEPKIWNDLWQAIEEQ